MKDNIYIEVPESDIPNIVKDLELDSQWQDTNRFWSSNLNIIKSDVKKLKAANISFRLEAE